MYSVSTHQLQVVEFHGDQIETIEHEGEHYVALLGLCRNLGIDPRNQREKALNEQTLLRGCVITLPSAGGPQDTVCIPVKKVAAWLFSVNPNKVRPDLRAKLELYQDECATVLDRYWTGQTVSRVVDPERRALIKALEANDALEQALTNHDGRLTVVEAKQSAWEQGQEFFTVVGFSRLMKQPVDHTQALKIGKLAGKLSRDAGMQIDAVHDRKWGKVNAYHQNILLNAFAEIMQ